ncbi:uncharacterized protein LOC135831415 isoform X6 [Planococcus citri]|uniref:uncharacterized protein LOC135831415 isoform X6 n=1 Tax=Planococcus citri TaxID=170843 RepID=UPI0031F92127
MEDDPIRNWREHSSDYDSYTRSREIPSLLQLSLDVIVKRLWMSEMNRDWFETRVLNCEQLKNKLHQNRDPTIHSLPPSIKQMVIDNIDNVGEQMNKQFSDLSGFGLLVSVFHERKFRDFAPLIWNLVIEENVVDYYVAQKIFSIINQEMNQGSIVMPSDEVSFYLRMWRSFPKDLRSRVIVILSNIDFNRYSYNAPKNDSRDLRFFTELITDFDAAERKKIWLENYEQLIVAANPSTLEHLMRICFDDGKQIIEFKRQYFVRSGRADPYCLRLIKNRRFAELDRFLIFCSHDELEAEELTKRILHKHFATDPIPQGYDVLFQILRSNASCICRVIKMPEFQHLFHMSTENLKEFCYSRINSVNFEELIAFFNYFFPPERNVSRFLQEAIKSFFTDRVLNRLKYSCLLRPKQYEDFLYLKRLNNVIGNLFVTSEAAARFKKEIMFCDGLFDLIRNIMLSSENPFRDLSTDRNRMLFVKEFVTMFLSSEQDLSKWKEDFVADSVKNMKSQGRSCSFRASDVDWADAKAWFLDSEEKVSQFKASLSMDEIMSIYLNSMSSCRTWYLDNILLWYFSNDEEQIVFFKLQKLRECIKSEYPSARETLLGRARTEFDNCTNDFDRCEVLRRALGREDRPYF